MSFKYGIISFIFYPEQFLMYFKDSAANLTVDYNTRKAMQDM